MRISPLIELKLRNVGGKREDLEKNPCGKGVNQQMTQLTWSTRAEDRTHNPLGPQWWEASVLPQHHTYNTWYNYIFFPQDKCIIYGLNEMSPYDDPMRQELLSGKFTVLVWRKIL
jgi:hypothetical protein